MNVSQWRVATFSQGAINMRLVFNSDQCETGVPHFSRFSRSGLSRRRHRGFFFYAAGGRIFIFNTSQAFTFTLPASPRE